jgi:nucleoside 2-deoxyribosyltransferase
MKIYFAGAIRGGREDAQLYKDIIAYLDTRGHVLTEHIGDPDLRCKGEESITDQSIYNRDMNWLRSADVIIAEVTIPSLGVGYELGIAKQYKIPTLCLYRTIKGKRLSAMINGDETLQCQTYKCVDEAKIHINNFLKLEHKV